MNPFWCPGGPLETSGGSLEGPWKVPGGLLEPGSKSDLQNGAGARNFGTPFWTLFGPLAAPGELHGAPEPQKVSSAEGLFSASDFGLSFGPS